MTIQCPNCSYGWDEVTDQQCHKCDGSGSVPITPGYIQSVVEQWEVLQQACFEALKPYCTVSGQHPDHLSSIESIDDDDVVFTGEYSHCFNCATKHVRLVMPTRFLWDEGFREEVARIQLEKLRQEKETVEQRQRQEAQARDARERALLAELKEKYE